MTITPETQQPLYAQGPFRRPRDPALEDGLIRWSRSWDDEPGAPEGVPEEDLLDAYCALSEALPGEMVDFLAKHPCPELDGVEYADVDEVADEFDGSGRILADRLREHARAVRAARAIGTALATPTTAKAADWTVANAFLNPAKRRAGWLRHSMAVELGTSWQMEREHFSSLLSDALQGSGVYTMANWFDHQRLALEPRTTTFIGGIMILLAREVGAEREYRCDSCGAFVHRDRAPRPGDAVYCKRPECKREQARRNQARWRANKAGG